METRAKYLLKNTSVFAVGVLGTKLINFFLVPFYTHVLSQEQYGTVDLIFTISMLVVPLIMFNVGEAIMRYAMDQDADLNKIFTVGLCAIAFGIVVSTLIIPLSHGVPLISNYRSYMYLYIVCCAAKEVLNGILRGKEQLKLYVGCNLLTTFLIAILNILFLVVWKKGIEGYLSAYVLAELVSIGFAFVSGKMYRYLGSLKFDFSLAKKMVLFSLAVIPNSMLWWAINSSDRIMVTAMCGVAANGILAVSYKLPSILTMISGVLMQAWKYSAIREHDSPDREEYTNRMLDSYMRGMILVSSTMLLFIKPITMILFEKSYYSAWSASVYLLIGFVFMGISTFVGTIYYVEKDMVGNMLSALAGAVSNIVLNFLLIPWMGASGATLSACISYFIILLYRYIDTKKYQNLKLFTKKYVYSIAFLILMVVGNQLDGFAGVAILLSGFIINIYFNRDYCITIASTLYSKYRKLKERR